ncbi:TPA: hypothetical protein L3261_002222 [Elizabethkingia anophelis]|nr:hypothetical protein [Elizabethkingia anophelis]MCT3729033.1 hypothetical protein [Elizabethkingia anophelis]MCT3825061.1 hypothetical protein [Elizabethkingia anophelis]MCT3932322.1 hypothetical protein [Elizabethkingia anophelis]MCT4113983.1 hypothetical protein [Elizabethkingia anophelis]
MRNIVFKTTIYVVISYVIFMLAMFIINKDSKVVKLSDFNKIEDYFYFFWLFIIPVLIDFLLVGLPIILIFKNKNYKKKYFYLIFTTVFIIEYFFSSWIYGSQSAMIKIIIYLILFILFFQKTIRLKFTKA